MRRKTRTAGILVGVLIGAGAATGIPPAPGMAAGPAAPVRALNPAARTITLVTGDVVSLAPAGDGRFAATVRPGPGRENVSFRTVEAGDGLRVLPSDTVPMVADGRLDAELFDVEHLLAAGFGDTDTATLPLIVKSGASALRTLKSTATTPLPSVGAVAMRADKSSLSSFWQSQTATSAGARAAADTTHIWLDAKVKPALDRSTVQIGAPTAWQAGLTGTGVKVAVLDTGIDATHPDLAGRISEARDFSGSADTTDHFGHGTHVASIAVGRKGVAPGAQLLVGKVLDDSGSGYESGIIEGMQWAVDRGAKVVNLSLGGDATDGTDPMSAAVDELSSTSGALFVIAAGNEGGDYTVGTPGAATAALTVGAVGRDDKLAEFSSRGPRLDQGLKPEITAPGVAIVAARAAGTTMGDPVDDLYTAASGTSMATPHVAGAAAILAQQHPDWTGSRLKDALVSTAKTGTDATVYGQGAGRVDLTRATTQKVTGTGVADFGLNAVGATPSTVTRTVTYANAGTAPITLTLKATMPGVTAAKTVTVPAGGTAAVPLTFDLKSSTTGLLDGWLTATGPNGVLVTTALGGTLDPPHHRVTFKAVDRTGAPTGVPVLQMFGDDRRFDVLGYLGEGDSGTVEVSEGDYLLDATIYEHNRLHPEDTLVTIPELRVDHDMTVVLDGRKAKPIRIDTPRPAEQQTVFSYYVHRITGTGRQIDNGFMDFSATEKLNVTPTAPLRKGKYEFSSRWQLVAPLARAVVPSAGTYDLRPMPASPVWTGTRHFDLATALTGRVKGKAVLLDATDADEYALVQQAADAGAAVALLMRGPDSAAWTNWDPSAEEKMPIPAMLVANDYGRKIMAKGRTLDLTMTPSSPYLYDILQVSSGRVPDGIVHRVTTANSFRITNKYADNGGLDWVREQRFGWRPWQEYAWNDTQRAVATPSVREEWVSTGDGIWQHHVHHAYPWNDLGAALDTGFAEQPRSYPRPGTATDTWASPVVRPATPAGFTNKRTGSVLNLRVADFVDATGKHFTIDEADRSSALLYRNGVLVSETRDAWRDVTVPAGSAAFKLTLTTARGGADWQYGTSTSTEWAFRSAKDGTLPLLQVSYAAPVSLTGTATTRPHTLGVSVPGACKLVVEISTDEGRTWKTTRVVPAGTGTVSLRVTATDQAGNTVKQTVLRAYGRS